MLGLPAWVSHAWLLFSMWVLVIQTHVFMLACKHLTTELSPKSFFPIIPTSKSSWERSLWNTMLRLVIIVVCSVWVCSWRGVGVGNMGGPLFSMKLVLINPLPENIRSQIWPTKHPSSATQHGIAHYRASFCDKSLSRRATAYWQCLVRRETTQHVPSPRKDPRLKCSFY